MKDLVIVESPSKTKKLASFLGDNYVVLSSVGHVRDLPKSGFGIDVEHNFAPQYVTDENKLKVVSDIKKQAKNSNSIYLATDMDREGEAIAWHVAYLLNDDAPLEDPEMNQKSRSRSKSASALASTYEIADKIKNKSGKSPKVYRVVFNSITKDAVLEAFEHPRKLDQNLIDAQQARRILDRLVGYKLSPLLWEKIRYGLSAGRVQSVAVRFVVERENEIKAFAKEPFFEFMSDFKTTKKEKLTGKLTRIDKKAVYIKKKFELFAGQYEASKTIIDGEKEVEKIKSDLDVSSFSISDIKSTEAKSHPSSPFTTATLQQAAASNFGMSPKRTMDLAQKLYEGGHITYMRTDSVHISPNIVSQIRNYIGSQYGAKYVSAHERYYKAKKSVKTQEAHEAIRPTHIKHDPDSMSRLHPDQRKLYSLIYKRTLASQMSPAVFDSTKVSISSTKSKYIFEANGSVLIFDGFLKVYNSGRKDILLPALKLNEEISLDKLNVEAKLMSAPPRYNESSLVRELEKFGIGRPSTYASIIQTVQSRGYVNKSEKLLYPTDNGVVVNNLLVDHFNEIVDIGFTAGMEQDLDSVAEGSLDWHDLIRNFYGPFDKSVTEKKKKIKKEDIVTLGETDEVCPECGKGKLIYKLGKYGKFLSCNRYPDCKFAKPVSSDDPQFTGDAGDANKDSQILDADLAKEVSEPCPECAGKLVIKEGKFGKFVACENYPKCKYTKTISKKVGMKCPDCGSTKGGEVIYRKTKKGRTFYGCSRYPECKFASWKRPR